MYLIVQTSPLRLPFICVAHLCPGWIYVSSLSGATERASHVCPMVSTSFNSCPELILTTCFICCSGHTYCTKCVVRMTEAASGSAIVDAKTNLPSEPSCQVNHNQLCCRRSWFTLYVFVLRQPLGVRCSIRSQTVLQEYDHGFAEWQIRVRGTGMPRDRSSATVMKSCVSPRRMHV